MERKSNNPVLEEVDLTGSSDFAAPAPKCPDKNGATENTSRIYERFIYGPINLDWICKAFELGPAAAFVGMALWYYSGLNKRRMTFRAGIGDLSLGGVSLSTVKRGRAALENAGLIRISRDGSKKSEIEIVDDAVNKVKSD